MQKSGVWVQRCGCVVTSPPSDPGRSSTASMFKKIGNLIFDPTWLSDKREAGDSSQAATDHFESCLSMECDEFIGMLLRVEPDYGYGWYHPDRSPYANHAAPAPFNIELYEIYTYDGRRRGVLGKVADPECFYNGFWFVSMTRHRGVFDFSENVAMYNFLLCDERPELGIPDGTMQARIWPQWTLKGTRHASGFGSIQNRGTMP